MISAFAKNLGISEALVDMKLKDESRVKRDAANLDGSVIIIASVVADDEATKKRLNASINEISFLSKMNVDLADAGIELKSIDITSIKTLAGKPCTKMYCTIHVLLN